MKNGLIFSLVCTLVAAASANATTRSFADIAQEIILTIAKGGDVTALGTISATYEHNPGRVGRLAGCRPKILPGSSQYALEIDWNCPDPANSVFTRIFISDKQLARIEFQPIVSQMRPTASAMASTTLPKPAEINRQFVKSVAEGSDPTLGGLIPIPADYLSTLSKMKGWDADIRKASSAKQIETLWSARRKAAGDAAQTLLHFDEAGRPIGIWLDQMQIRVEAVILR